MVNEEISKIQISDSGVLFLILKNKGSSENQYIYREASGVYWDNELNGFKSTIPNGDWTYSQWYTHIVAVVKSSLAVKLSLVSEVSWDNVPESVKTEILELSKC